MDCNIYFYLDLFYDPLKYGYNGKKCYLGGLEESTVIATFYDKAFWITIACFFANVIYLTMYVVSNRLHLYYESHHTYDNYIPTSFFSLITPIFLGCACVEFFVFVRAVDYERIGSPLDLFAYLLPVNPDFPRAMRLFHVVITCINAFIFLVVSIAHFCHDNFFILNTLIFIAKVLFLMLLFIWIRGAVPRYRYDQLMTLQWRKYLPLSLSLLLAYMAISALFFVKI